MRRVTLAVLWTLVLGTWGCAGGGDEPGGDGDTPGGTGTGAQTSVTWTSAECVPFQTNPSFKVGNLVATGTASGPKGTVFHLGVTNGGQSTTSFDCGGWTLDGIHTNNTSCVNQTGPESITWSVTQEVYWCTFDCDASTAFNNADKAVKHAYVTVELDGTAEKRVNRDVTCP